MCQSAIYYRARERAVHTTYLPISVAGTVPECAHLDSRLVLSSISSAFLSTSSGVSIYNSVPVGLSHTMGTEAGSRPHSSVVVFLSGFRASKKHAVAIEPSYVDSVRNLSNTRESGNVFEGMKSQGRRTKSCLIRFAMWRRTAQVPTPNSAVSSYVWISTRRDGNDVVDESELMKCKISALCREGHTSRTSAARRSRQA